MYVQHHFDKLSHRSFIDVLCDIHRIFTVVEKIEGGNGQIVRHKCPCEELFGEVSFAFGRYMRTVVKAESQDKLRM